MDFQLLPRRTRQTALVLVLLALSLVFVSLHHGPQRRSPSAPGAQLTPFLDHDLSLDASHTNSQPSRPSIDADSWVIVSLASTTSRLEQELPIALWSLLRQSLQPSEIRVHLPVEDQELVTALIMNNTLDPVFSDNRVRIEYVEDVGPASKLLYTLQSLLRRASSEDIMLLDVKVVVVDDDHAASPDLVRTLVDAHERVTTATRADAVVGLRGWRVRKELEWGVGRDGLWRHVIEAWKLEKDYQVGVVTANEGYLVLPRYFLPKSSVPPYSHYPPEQPYHELAPIFSYDDAPEAAHLVDDIWISGHLASLSIPRYVVPLPLFTSPSLDITLTHPLESHMSSHGVSRGEANDATLKYFGGKWEKDLWWEESEEVERENGEEPRWKGMFGRVMVAWQKWCFGVKVRTTWGLGVRWS